jgi:hypothetical protein
VRRLSPGFFLIQVTHLHHLGGERIVAQLECVDLVSA